MSSRNGIPPQCHRQQSPRNSDRTQSLPPRDRLRRHEHVRHLGRRGLARSRLDQIRHAIVAFHDDQRGHLPRAWNAPKMRSWRQQLRRHLVGAAKHIREPRFELDRPLPVNRSEARCASGLHRVARHRWRDAGGGRAARDARARRSSCGDPRDGRNGFRRDADWPAYVVGAPERMKVALSCMAEATGLHEFMIRDFLDDPGLRLRTYQLLAAAFALSDRP